MATNRARVVLEQFNDTFTELLEDLGRVFPGDSDFKMYKLGAQAAMVHSEDLVRSMFHEKVVVPYEGQLLECNEEFFLSREYAEVAHEFEDAEDLIRKLKSSWHGLGPAERDTVWRYLRVLVLLDRKYESVVNGQK